MKMKLCFYSGKDIAVPPEFFLFIVLFAGLSSQKKANLRYFLFPKPPESEMSRAGRTEHPLQMYGRFARFECTDEMHPDSARMRVLNSE